MSIYEDNHGEKASLAMGAWYVATDAMAALGSKIEDFWLAIKDPFVDKSLTSQQLSELLAHSPEVWQICSSCETFTRLNRDVLLNVSEHLGSATKIRFLCNQCKSENGLCVPDAHSGHTFAALLKHGETFSWEESFGQ
jgi:hypothetical protein